MAHQPPKRAEGQDEEPHDILAAEAFALGAGDPELHREAAHDVLAAEAFALGEADQGLPRDSPHDVLAADEFPLPAARHHAVPPPGEAPVAGIDAGRRRPLPRRLLATLAVAGLVILGRRRRSG